MPSPIRRGTIISGSGSGSGGTVPPFLPPTPAFLVRKDPSDGTAAQIYSLTFPSDPHLMVGTITSGTFTYTYQDPDDTHYSLASPITTGSTVLTLTAAPSTLANGDYIQVGAEIMLCGTPGGVSVPVTRAQLGTTAAAALSGVSVFHLSRRSATVSFPLNFFGTPAATSWAYSLSLPGATVAAVTGYVSNGLGDGPASTTTLTALAGNGLVLDATASGTDVIPPPNITSVTTSEVANSRYLDTTDQTTHAKIRGTAVLTADVGTQDVTGWLSLDNGANFIWIGWRPMSGTSGQFDMDRIVQLTDTSLKIALRNGRIGGDPTKTLTLSQLNAITTGIVISPTFVFPKIAVPSAAGVTAASSTNPINITDGLGLPNWAIQSVTWTDPEPVNTAAANYDPDAWYTCLTFQCTDSAGNPAPGLSAGPGLDQGGDEVEVDRFPTNGNTVHSTAKINSYGFNPPGTIYTYACLRIYTVNRNAVNSFKDPVNSVKQTCWGGATKVLLNFGQLPGYTMPGQAFAPNVISITANTPVFSTVGGLPKWSTSGLIKLPTPFTAIRRLHLIIAELGELLSISATTFAPDGLNQISYTIPPQSRDTVTFNYTLQCWVENADGILTGSPATAPLTVTGTAAPFSSTAPAPLNISVAHAVVHYVPNGHNYDFYVSGDFTGPTDPTGINKQVRVTVTDAAVPAGVQGTLIMDGPFTSGATIPFANTGSAISVPSSPQTWHVNFLPINADSTAGATFSIPITVSPNIVSSVTCAEGVQFTELGGGGAKSHVLVNANITTTNGPGFSPYQSLTFYWSTDNGAHWFGLDWVDITATGVNQAFEIWRPTDASYTCRTAVAIGAFNFPNATFRSPGTPTGPILDSALPANAVRSSNSFVLSRVGAPLPSDVFSASFLARTATGSNNIQNDVTLMRTADGATYWGMPDGVQWSNPVATTDQNLWRSIITVQFVDSAGNAAPPEQQGIERAFASWGGDPSQTGAYKFQGITWWTFNPVGSPYTRARFRIYGISRSATDWNDPTFSTLQTTAWSGAAFHDVIVGAAPASGIIFSLSAGTGISITSGNTVNVKLAGVNPNILPDPSFAAATPGSGPNGAPSWTGLTGQEFGPEATAGFGRTDANYYRLSTSGVSGPNTGCRSDQISVNPSVSYKFSAYVTNLSAPSGSIFVEIEWLTSGGGSAGSPSVGAVVTASSCSTPTFPGPVNWTLTSVTGLSPFSAAFARVRVQCSSGNSTSGFWYCDDCYFEITPTTTGPMGLDSSGGLTVNLTGPLYSDVTQGGAANLKIANDFVVSGGQLTQNVVNLAKATNFGNNLDGSAQFSTASGFFVVNKIGVNFLAAGTALFAGDAIFSRQGGGQVTINSAGVAIGSDTSFTPTSSVTVTATGVTLTKGFGNFQLTADGFTIFNASGGTVNGTASGITISNGSSSVLVSASAVSITQGTLALNLNGVTTTIANVSDSGALTTVGVRVKDNSTNYYSTMAANSFYLVNPSNSRFAQLAANGTFPNLYGVLLVSNPATFVQATVDGSGSLSVQQTFPTLNFITMSLNGGSPAIQIRDSTGNLLSITATGIVKNGVSYNFP